MVDKTQQVSTPIRNPFTPGFGKVPIYFAGREDILSDMLQTFEEDETNICSLFVGARGTGKTALLSYLANQANSYGWISVNVSAVPGMLEDIIERTQEAAAHLISPKGKSKLKSINVAGVGGISWEDNSSEKLNWRSRMNLLLDALNEQNVGLLITVDEVDVSLDEMSQLVVTYQHFVRENRKVALLMAGLPYNILTLLSGKNTSFLRRAPQFHLGSLSDYEVEEAFKLTVEDGGRFISQDALDEAVSIIDGFPYMLQLLGYRAWRSRPKAPDISFEDIQAGAQIANKELETSIFDVTYSELSKADKAFLTAMLKDSEASEMKVLAHRLNKTSGHVSTYKKRLVQAGVIEENIDGNLRFALPGFKDYFSGRI